MNREIKFRGKRFDNNNWVYGGISGEGSNHWIYAAGNAMSVISETIGQFTGLHDRNGKEIYEGDIVNMSYQDEVFRLYPVEYVQSECLFSPFKFPGGRKYEVVGNIHDSPELLKS